MGETPFREDNYLPCSRYQDHDFGADGFAKFQDPENNQFYFSYSDEDIFVFRSEGYAQESGRDNGIASVKKNMSDEAQYAAKMLPDGKWVLSLKAKNHQEIARSCKLSSEAEALGLLPAARAKRKAEMAAAAAAAAALAAKAKAAAPASNRKDDDYLACKMYEGHPSAPGNDDFSIFTHESEHYFAVLDDKDNIVLRSEGYTSASARDNGIASVIKNRKDKSKYSIEEKMKYFFVVLKAGNHQEIARSCPYKTREAAHHFIHPPAPVAATKAASTAKQDDYLACKAYKGHQTSAVHADFTSFEKDGEYFFAMVDGSGDVRFRSERYQSAAARDNGIQSVVKNREDLARYSMEEKMGYHFVILKAGNHQEIARSCPYKSKDEATGYMGWKWYTAAGVAAAAATVPTPTPPAKPEEKEDDYLVCSQYRNRKVNDKENNVALFKHDNGLYYFALYDDKGKVRLRSEGFVDAKTRDEELSGVLKYKDEKSLYTKITRGEFYMDVLSDKTGREVGRSCLKSSKPVVAAPVDQEDDYLACKEYANRKISDKKTNIVMFKHDNGLYYFALYDKSGDVRLRSEGFVNAKTRDEELSGVLKYKDDKSMYSRIEKGKYYIEVLKDKTGREVGRSCLQKKEKKVPVVPIAAAAAAVAVPKPAPKPTPKPKPKAAPVAAPVAAKKGFNWWWLLLPLLLLGLFFLLRGCDGKTPPPPPPPKVTAPAAKPAPAPKPAAVAPIAVVCDLNWILFDFDKYNIRSDARTELNRLAALLKKHPKHTARLIAHTDARGSNAYNDRLSANRSKSAKDYLIAQGISGNRINTAARSEGDPYTTNTTDDSGRKYNRRVELYLLDENGKQVCDSNPPTVPNNLKIK